MMHGATEPRRVMIVGAGMAGQMLLREYQNSTMLFDQVCCFVDDDPMKQGSTVMGVPVAGYCAEVAAVAAKYAVDLIVISIPTLSPARQREILSLCRRTGLPVQAVPGLYQLLNGEELRPVDPDALLEREPVTVEHVAIEESVRDRVILVTGGGGSIGSELCRQLASYHPKQLIVVDIYENNAYDLQQELMQAYPSLDLVVLIASVRDENRMEQILQIYRPDRIYHAAAHKHVPLMEESPAEAIKNNVWGTYLLAKLAVKYRVSGFVLISSDKAVNPTNIMGASKRLCEMIVQYFSGKETCFSSVRFGNVLGSNGSVIPLFERQIRAGGPVTVTHPDVIRYFMTVPEAVRLVLQAGAYADGNVYILDMGEPIRIDTLARNLIRLHGFVPDRDIAIQYTGLRPGEKLYEELLMGEEGLKKTANDRIFIGSPIPLQHTEFEQDLQALFALAFKNGDVIPLVQKLVPTYNRRDH
ncbi:MAG: polysaccharide biosynthesis protein [Clostridia bacterium]|nr:polysaccharide biosynthesis protein [Clostridia bacterium]